MAEFVKDGVVVGRLPVVGVAEDGSPLVQVAPGWTAPAACVRIDGAEFAQQVNKEVRK